LNDPPPTGDERSTTMSSAPLAHLVAHAPDADPADAEGDDTPRALLVRLQRADVAAITLVYRQHHVAVRAFAQRLVGDVEAAEDLVQDVFVALPSAIVRFRGDCTLRTFLVSIAVNHAKNHVRAAARRRAALARLGREPEPASPDPHRDMERRQLGDRLVHALDALPLEQRIAIVLSEIEERTSAEIATIVGAPEGTVRTRIFHAKRKLREILGVQGGRGER
jgi:RNA polymerase sigma-70 factor (ECF subfamily)